MTEEPQATERLITPTSIANMTSTPTIGINNILSPDAILEMTPPPCPDAWFNTSSSPTPPIFLLMLISSRIYVAYRYDLPPDKEFFFDLPQAPAQSYAASFSQDQQLIAYYVPIEETSAFEYWISDVTLCNPILIYPDHDVGIREPYDYDYIEWGPGDKTVIFRSTENEFPMLIYQLENQSAEFWQGVCEDIIYLDETDEVVVGCSHDNKYSYLHMDGTITTSTITPKTTDAPVVAWSFSKKGDAAYITSTNVVYLLRTDGQKTKLPLKGLTKGFTFMSFWYPDPLQWATAQNRLLVLAYDPEEKRCPAEQACWFLIEGESGEVIWWLEPQIIKMGPQWQWNEISTMYPAAISPDGELLALQYYQDPGKLMVIVRIATNEVLTIADIFSDRMAWPAR